NQKNTLLPDLRFAATYDITSLGSRLDGAQANDNALRGLSSNRFNDWSLALRLNVPIGYREANTNVRIARLNLARQWLGLREEETRSLSFLEQQYRRIIEKYALLETRRAQRDSFAEQVRVRFALFAVGKETVDRLLEAQRFWANALATEYQAVVDYNNSLA